MEQRPRWQEAQGAPRGGVGYFSLWGDGGRAELFWGPGSLKAMLSRSSQPHLTLGCLSALPAKDPCSLPAHPEPMACRRARGRAGGSGRGDSRRQGGQTAKRPGEASAPGRHPPSGFTFSLSLGVPPASLERSWALRVRVMTLGWSTCLAPATLLTLQGASDFASSWAALTTFPMPAHLPPLQHDSCITPRGGCRGSLMSGLLPSSLPPSPNLLSLPQGACLPDLQIAKSKAARLSLIGTAVRSRVADWLVFGREEWPTGWTSCGRQHSQVGCGRDK